jgi:hypothetical protein
MSKWTLTDPSAPQRVVVGKLTDVHISGGGITSDDDTNIVIEPDSDGANQMLLTNRHGQINLAVSPDGRPLLECEINVKSDWRDQHKDWVSSLTEGEGTVTAQGVWVDDNDHDSKTELHPMDVIFGTVTSSKIPGDWINSLASERGLEVNKSMLAFRFAVASDDRGGIFFDSPPLATLTRPTTFVLKLPSRPAEGDMVPAWEMRSSLSENAFVYSTPRDFGGSKVLDVTVVCRGQDDDGPGVLLGEIVTFWSSPPPDPCPALLKQMQRLTEKIDEEPGPDATERKKILQTLGELTRRAVKLGCLGT